MKGHLAFVDDAGAVIVRDLASGAEQRFVISQGRATNLALSLDRTQLALMAVPGEMRAARLVKLELQTGAQHTIEHELDVYVGDLQWGAGGALLYRSFVDGRRNGESHLFVVEPGATKGRLVARDGWVELSPFSAHEAHIECLREPPTYGCKQRLVVADASGKRRRVLDGSGVFQRYGFTPDGRSLITTDGPLVFDAERRLMRRDLETGAKIELGVGDTYDFYAMPGGTLVSADSQEALFMRGEALVAVKLDGSGTRAIATGSRAERELDITNATFTRDRGVLYDLRENLDRGNDVPRYVNALWLLDGERRVQLAPPADCGWATISRSRKLAARACPDGIHVYSLAEARELRVFSAQSTMEGGPGAISFDGDDGSLIVAFGPGWALPDAEHELRYFGLDGSERMLARTRAHTAPGRHGTYPSFVFWDD